MQLMYFVNVLMHGADCQSCCVPHIVYFLLPGISHFCKGSSNVMVLHIIDKFQLMFLQKIRFSSDII
jgi:hypothetical protein